MCYLSTKYKQRGWGMIPGPFSTLNRRFILKMIKNLLTWSELQLV